VLGSGRAGYRRAIWSGLRNDLSTNAIGVAGLRRRTGRPRGIIVAGNVFVGSGWMLKLGNAASDALPSRQNSIHTTLSFAIERNNLLNDFQDISRRYETVDNFQVIAIARDHP